MTFIYIYIYNYMPYMWPFLNFFTRKTSFQKKKFLRYTFFTQFVLSHTSENNISPNIGGADTWAVSPTQTLAGPPPVPISLPHGPVSSYPNTCIVIYFK